MKSSNRIIEILNEAGYKNTGDNRSYEVRSLNNLLNLGMIDFKFINADDYNSSEHGKSFWFSINDKSGNMIQRCTAYKVMYLGHWYYGHFIPKSKSRLIFGERVSESCNNYVLSIYDILCRVARLISIKKEGIDFLKEDAYTKHGDCSCQKCAGTGFLPCFAHYAQGICFDCGGTGINGNILKLKIAQSIK